MRCNAFFSVKLRNCDIFYYSCLTESDSERIQRLQNLYLRSILGIRKYQHIGYTFRENKWWNSKKLSLSDFYLPQVKISYCLYNKIDPERISTTKNSGKAIFLQYVDTPQVTRGYLPSNKINGVNLFAYCLRSSSRGFCFKNWYLNNESKWIRKCYCINGIQNISG